VGIDAYIDHGRNGTLDGLQQDHRKLSRTLYLVADGAKLFCNRCKIDWFKSCGYRVLAPVITVLQS
jgi:hypothetical protein